MIRSIFAHRHLILAIAKRDATSRYRGSALGSIWAFAHPLLMLFVYTFVFSVVFKARWNSSPESSKIEFALVLLSGLIVFNIFAEFITRAPLLVIDNSNYVKKLVFPLEILPISALLAAAFHAAISLAIWMLAYFASTGRLPATIAYLPIVIAPYFLFLMGIGWILSGIGPYFRDIAQATSLLSTIFLFLSPVFYPASALPPGYRMLIYINPLTPFIEQTRSVMIYETPPNIITLSILWTGSTAIAMVGYAFFQKVRKGFGDVL